MPYGSLISFWIPDTDGWKIISQPAVSLQNAINWRMMEQQALTAMFRSFNHATPRAEICCQIGYHFKSLGEYKLAAFWFELATKLEKPQNSWGFCQKDCWGYIPCIECAVCYDKLGDLEKAEYFNNRAASYKPESPSVLYNIKYFEDQKKAHPSGNKKESE